MKNWVRGIVLLLALCLTGCRTTEPTKVERPVVEEERQAEALIPVNGESTFSYHDVEPIKEETLREYVSDDGLARIEKKKSYYEVYLNLEKGSHLAIGYAYGEVIKKAYPNLAEVLEPYIYENIYSAFPEITDDFAPVSSRVEAIKKNINLDYAQEIEGLANSLATDTQGFNMNGKFSKEELDLIHFIPDVLRGTQCSGTAVYGGKSATGHTITLRILEWLMGNENQMAKAHAIIHFQNGEKSVTTYGVLGLLEAISATNSSGVFAGILDSSTEGIYTPENKASYPFALRYALEQFGTAKEVGRYMNSQGKNFTFSHNILVTDPNQAYVVENAVGEEGICALREASSPLMKGVTWEQKEAIAVVNGFVLSENVDNMTDDVHNMIRWKKFNEHLKAYDKIDVADLKDMVTKDDPNGYGSKLYSDYTYQIIVVDGETGSVDIAFAPAKDEFPLKPDFVRVTEHSFKDIE